MTPKGHHRSRKPQIHRIEAASGPRLGRPVKQARPGDSLRIIGARFGRDPAGTRVWFDEVAASPLTVGFRSDELVVTVPDTPHSTSCVRVQAPGGRSDPVGMKVIRPRPYRGDAGAPTAALFAAIDEYAALTAATARAVLPALAGQPVAAADLKIAAASLDGARLTAQKCFALWMSWAPLQAGQQMAPLRTIEFYDDVVASAGLAERMGELSASTFGADGALGAVSAELQQNLFAQAAAGAGGSVISDALAVLDFGDLGFWIQEGVKAVEAIENIFKVLRPSVDAGPVDASVSLGEIFSGIAKFINIVGQILSKIAGDESAARIELKIDLIGQGIERLEGKADRAEEKLDQIAAVLAEIREAVRRIEAEVKANNGALRTLGDLLGRTLVGQGWIVDPRQTLTGNPVPDRDVKQELHDIEDKVDRLEAKADRQEEKLDRQEEKLDREEEKLDRLAVLDRPAEGSVAAQRGSADRVTATVAALRPQDNRVFLRAAVDADRRRLDELARWSGWVDFDRPPQSSAILQVSLDLQYREGSDTELSALLSARDGAGRVYHRAFEGAGHGELLDPATWSDWQDFLEQP